MLSNVFPLDTSHSPMLALNAVAPSGHWKVYFSDNTMTRIPQGEVASRIRGVLDDRAHREELRHSQKRKRRNHKKKPSSSASTEQQPGPTPSPHTWHVTFRPGL